MKTAKIFIVMAVIFMGTGVICYAASIGPVEPLGPMKVGISGEYNGIYDRDLGSSEDVTSGEVKSSNQGYVELALGITDWYNVYAKLGTANLEEKLNWSNNRSQTIKYDYGFLWAIGNNASYDLGKKFSVGGDIQFNMWFADADSISGTNNPTFTQKGSLKAYDFQAAAYLMYKYEIGTETIIPYLGGYYSRFTIDIRKNTTFEDNAYTYVEDGKIKSKDNFGVLVGLNMPATDNLSLKLEGRFIAETAMTAGASYKF